MAGAKMGLGGGLSNLFGSDTSDLMEESLDNGTKNLPLAKIEPNPDQPRKVFDQVSLDDAGAAFDADGTNGSAFGAGSGLAAVFDSVVTGAFSASSAARAP